MLKVSGYPVRYFGQENQGEAACKNLIEEAGGFDTSLPVCSPYALWLKLSLKYEFIPTARPTFMRRRHSGNLSTYTFANRKMEFDLLEHTYKNDFANSGMEVITQKRAMKRLSREAYRAGRCAVREKLHAMSCQLLKQSFRQYPNFKSLMWWMIAAAKLKSNLQARGAELDIHVDTSLKYPHKY
jgi:hypothetical protein